MKRYFTKNRIFLVIFLLFVFSCAQKAEKSEEKDAAQEEIKTPVTVTNVKIETLSDTIELNATSTFLQNNYVKSITTGYIKSANAKPGQYVKEGEVLFNIETKESLVIGNSISTLDSSFKFTGLNTIKATAHGYITQLNHQAGDYVQDGEQLAVISDMSSFSFLLNLPYELRPFVLNKKTVDLLLPDGIRLKGRITSVMPTVDSLAQTQPVVIKVDSKEPIPQNLIAKVFVVKTAKENAQTLPKSAVLSDEAQTDFWVMKMIDSNTAVKTPVQKGIELHNKVEILSPRFSSSDLILTSGNYGLSDTAKVIVQK